MLYSLCLCVCERERERQRAINALQFVCVWNALQCLVSVCVREREMNALQCV